MFCLIALVILLSGSQSSAQIVKQVVTSDSSYVEFEGNYAISASELEQFNWASVNVNGEDLKIITLDCNVVDKKLNEIGEVERRALQREANPESSLHNIVTFNDYEFASNSPNALRIYFYTYGEVLIRGVSDDHLLISSPGLEAANIKFFSSDDLRITFIFSDNSVLMRPERCLDNSTRHLVEVLETEWAEARMKWEEKNEAREKSLS